MTTDTTTPGQGLTPLWDNNEIIARYRQAFERDPDVHIYALMTWMRDDLTAERASLTERIALLVDANEMLQGNMGIMLAAVTEAKAQLVEAHRQTQELATLQAQATEDGWKLAMAEDMLERIREKLREMPETFDELGRHMYGDR